MPARPFLAPVAVAMSEEVARAVGAAVAAALRGDSTGSSAADEQSLNADQVSSTSSDTGVALLTLGAVALGWALGRRSSSPGLPTTSGPTISEAAILVPPPVEGEKPVDVLKPSGQNVGTPGENSGVRVLPGSENEARELFDRLTKGGTDITRPGHIGKVIRLPDGSVISYRPKSKSGPLTIDVNVPGLKIWKLKFPGESG